MPLFLRAFVCARAACGFGRVKPMNSLTAGSMHRQGLFIKSEKGFLSGLVQTRPTACDCIWVVSLFLLTLLSLLHICSQHFKVITVGVVEPEALLCHFSPVSLSPAWFGIWI